MKENKNNHEEQGAKMLEKNLVVARKNKRYKTLVKNTVYLLLAVAAISILLATLFMPVFEISGSSMNPAYENGDIVAAVKTTKLQRGDVCCLYYNNHILVKRVIGLAGDVIMIDDDGNVSVNGEVISEPYVSEKQKGECDIEFPYTVPERTVFVLGDNRSTFVDSRNSLIGCISVDEVVGKIVFRVWPFRSFGAV